MIANSSVSSLRIAVNGRTVSGRLRRPPNARAVYVCAHGAGAGMDHPFMEAFADRLFLRGLATLRFNFPYMEEGKKPPDRPPVLEAAVRAAVHAASELAPDLPVIAGGKSMGGRMTSRAQSQQALPGVRGLVFIGFPLHPPKKRGTERADHLASIRVPMLFLAGTRDALADLELLRPVCSRLGPRATLAVIDGADHAFHVLKRSGRTDAEVLDELADAVDRWLPVALAKDS